LPIPLSESQCVLHKHEILICGGYQQRACYSYHILKNEYKFICEYSSDVELMGHCVVKLINNNNKDINEITLLSFGGNERTKRHTLVMKYVSIWSNILDISNKSNELNNYNEWIPFTDNHNHPIIIGRDQDHDYRGMRAVIGGSNNHLLFITYLDDNISVFDLNTFRFIKRNTLPTNNYIQYHCLVSNSKNGQEQGMVKTNQEKNKQNYQMLLFCCDTGLSIEYDEDNNTFQFHQLHVCDDIAPFYKYAYVCINDVILFFGGYDWDGDEGIFSKSVYKYSIGEDKWMIFQNTLSSTLRDCIAILSEEYNCIHIIGGKYDKKTTVSTHLKTKVREWDSSQLVMFIYFDEIQSKNEIKCIIEYWLRFLKIKLGWIDDFYTIIMKCKAQLNKYFSLESLKNETYFRPGLSKPHLLTFIIYYTTPKKINNLFFNNKNILQRKYRLNHRKTIKKTIFLSSIFIAICNIILAYPFVITKIH
ncbi:hypothetical protein RFI_02510, partial [Reticulomyxa filosa]